MMSNNKELVFKDFLENNTGILCGCFFPFGKHQLHLVSTNLKDHFVVLCTDASEVSTGVLGDPSVRIFSPEEHGIDLNNCTRVLGEFAKWCANARKGNRTIFIYISGDFDQFDPTGMGRGFIRYGEAGGSEILHTIDFFKAMKDPLFYESIFGIAEVN